MDYERPLYSVDHRSWNPRKRGTSELDNGRHKRPSTNEGHSLLNAKTIDTIYRILCPIKKIGSVLGKGGDIVNAIREETHAKIRVADAIPGADERVIIIFSYQQENVERIESAQTELDNQYMKPHCPAQDALLKIHDRIAADEYIRGGVVHEKSEPNDVVTVRILVPNNQVGCLLGKGGSVIQKLRSDTNANIRILSAEHLPPCAMSSDELVQISGKPNIVRRALYVISTHLHHHPRKDNPSLEDIISASILDHYQSGPVMLPPVAHGNPAFSRYTPPGYDGYRNEPYGHDPSSFNGVNVRDQAGTLEDFSIKILCATDKIGGIIGKGGGNVRQLERQTGARIHVEGTDPDDVNRVIVVSSKEAFLSSISPTIEAVLQLQKKASEISEKGSINTRLLVSSGKIGCLLGQGGNVISEMRRRTRADIRISSKASKPKCASPDEELVQISGNESVTEAALLEIASRLRARSLQGGPIPLTPLHDGPHGFDPPEGLSVRGRHPPTIFDSRYLDSYDHPKAYDYPKDNDYPKYTDYPKGYDHPKAYEYPKGYDYPKGYEYPESYDYAKSYDDYAARYDHSKNHQKIYDYPRSSDYGKAYDYPKDAGPPLYSSQGYPGPLRPTGYSSMSSSVEVNAANISVPGLVGGNVSDAHQVPSNASWRYMDHRPGR